MKASPSCKFLRVSLGQIDGSDGLTDFSLSPVPESLETSVREIGVMHPVILVRSGQRFRVVCGHRRLKICQGMKVDCIPAGVLDTNLDAEAMLGANLTENHSHRIYSDIEKAQVLGKLAHAGAAVDRIIRKYMPILGIESSKKLFQDFSAAGQLTPGMQKILHELKVPLRVISLLCRWDPASRDAAEELFSVLRPGVNKCRELLELAGETARREESSPAGILLRREVQSVLEQDLPAPEKYDLIHQTLYRWRYPALSDLQKRVASALDQLRLDPKTKVRFQESFESGEIRIELKFQDRDSLIRQIEKLSRASQSPAMDELIRIIRDAG